MTKGVYASRPTVTIVHELPGRVRFRLSEPVRGAAALENQVKGHEGIHRVECTPITRSVLVVFDEEVVSREEIGFRLALAYSFDQGGGPVRLFSVAPRSEITDSAFYSAVALSVALALRLAGAPAEVTRLLDMVAGLGTTGAVVAHGWQEAKREGFFDPEVFSVLYLVIALARSGGVALPAAAFTWLTTFARHLVQVPETGVELKPTCLSSECDPQMPTEVVVSPVAPASGATIGLRLLSSGLRYTLTGGTSTGAGALARELVTLAKHHGEVLEGLGELRRGIPVKVRP